MVLYRKFFLNKNASRWINYELNKKNHKYLNIALTRVTTDDVKIATYDRKNVITVTNLKTYIQIICILAVGSPNYFSSCN